MSTSIIELGTARIYTCKAQKEHLQGILALHHRYHKNVVGTERAGFLTCTFSIEELREFASDLGIIVTVADQRGKTPIVIGYNILFTVERMLQYPQYKGLIAEYHRQRPEVDQSTVAVARQYCVAEEWRASGHVVKSLYDLQRTLLLSLGYHWSIGEVDSRNRASLAAARRFLGYRFLPETYTTRGDGTHAEITWHIGERDERQ